MHLHQLIYFAEVARLGSINKAADSLKTTQPNISKAMSSLEAELNIQIFIRTNRGVKLTEVGENLLRYSKTIMDQIELMEKLSEVNPPETLSISAYPMLTMSTLVSEFYNDHKSENIKIRLTEQRMHDTIQSVVRGDSEIGIVVSNREQRKELNRTLKYNNLEHHDFATDTWVVNVGPQSPLYDKKIIHMQELMPFTMVRRPDDYFTSLTNYLEIDSVLIGDLDKVIYVNDSGAMINLIHNTDIYRIGITASNRDFSKYGIRSIPIYNCNIQIDISWIKREKDRLSSAAVEFLNYMDCIYSSLS